MRRLNEKGMTLIELLVVIIILGILATIAVLGFSTIIQKSKDNAFVANAFSLKEAAEKYYFSSGGFADESNLPLEITFDALVTNGFIERFKDPDSNELMPEDGNGTFVLVDKEDGSLTYSICYVGTERKLCNGVEADSYEGISFQQLNTTLITEK